MYFGVGKASKLSSKGIQVDLAEAVAGYEATMSEWDAQVAAAKEAAGPRFTTQFTCFTRTNV